MIWKKGTGQLKHDVPLDFVIDIEQNPDQPPADTVYYGYLSYEAVKNLDLLTVFPAVKSKCNRKCNLML